MTNQNELLRRIQVLNKQRRFKICSKAVAQFVTEMLQFLRQAGPALSVVFVSARRIRSLNKEYLGRNYATDVLSFSYSGVEMEDCPFLGEVIIAPDVAALQAARYRASPEKELRKLLVHGILHLLGYNHETDRGQMNRLQGRLLRRKVFDNASSLAILREIR